MEAALRFQNILVFGKLFELCGRAQCSIRPHTSNIRRARSIVADKNMTKFLTMQRPFTQLCLQEFEHPFAIHLHAYTDDK